MGESGSLFNHGSKMVGTGKTIDVSATVGQPSVKNVCQGGAVGYCHVKTAVRLTSPSEFLQNCLQISEVF